MRINDGKDKFLRRLNLDKETRKLIRWYRGISKKMKNEPDEKRGE